MAVILLFVESCQICIKGWEYFTFMNLLETSANILAVVNMFTPLDNDFFALMGLLIYYKMIMTLGVIKSFRALIGTIVACVVDMIPFLTIVMIVTFAFAVLNLIDPYTDDDGKSRGIWWAINDQYRFMYGENPDADSGLKIALYVLFSLFMCIVMLNLLIAIISATFEDTISNAKAEDLKQVCEIVTEFGELVKFLLRRKDYDEVPMYLHFANYLSDVEETKDMDKWDIRIKNLNNKVDDNHQEIMENVNETWEYLND